jgi:hypothetical protein
VRLETFSELLREGTRRCSQQHAASDADGAFRSQPTPHSSILCIGSSPWPYVFPMPAPTAAIGAIIIALRGPSHHPKVRFRHAPANGTLQARRVEWLHSRPWQSNHRLIHVPVRQASLQVIPPQTIAQRYGIRCAMPEPCHPVRQRDQCLNHDLR